MAFLSCRHRVLIHITPLGLEFECSGMPSTSKDQAWVADCENEDCKYDHGALQDHEAGLVVGDRSPESALELDDTVDGSDEDEDRGSKES